MNTPSPAERSLRDGDLALALQHLQGQVRSAPGDARLRIFLFQLLAVHGEWERAAAQLEVAARLDPAALAMAQMYLAAIDCERLRAHVFAGKISPMIFGQPEPWLALLIESLLRAGRGEAALAAQLRADAFEQATPVGGTLDGQPFSWIADADSRLGPVLEAIINGKYYWVPFAHLRSIVLEQPHDLRDMVWMPAHFLLANGGEAVGLVPTRYPGSENAEPALALGRKTEWLDVAPGAWHGLGQRILATDAGEVPLMDIRKIVFDAPVEPG